MTMNIRESDKRSNSSFFQVYAATEDGKSRTECKKSTSHKTDNGIFLLPAT